MMRYLSTNPATPDIQIAEGIYFEPEREIDRTSRQYNEATRSGVPSKEDREREEALWAALSGPVTVRKAASR